MCSILQSAETQSSLHSSTKVHLNLPVRPHILVHSCQGWAESSEGLRPVCGSGQVALDG